MPLMKIDLIKGRTKEEIKQILDISYEVMLSTFDAPEGDRYQIVNQHEDYEMQILDTGLGVERTNEVIIFTIITIFFCFSKSTNNCIFRFYKKFYIFKIKIIMFTYIFKCFFNR